MADVVIENPVLNSPFQEPIRYFRFTEDGIMDEVAEERHISQFFVPIPRAKKISAKQLSFETEWTADRVEENKEIYHIRERVDIWRKGRYVGITIITAKLLEFWKREGRERRLFFCQIEALDAARNLWIPEVNDHGGFGRWAFLEIVDPWDAKNTIRKFIKGEKVDGVGPVLQEKN